MKKLHGQRQPFEGYYEHFDHSILQELGNRTELVSWLEYDELHKTHEGLNSYERDFVYEMLDINTLSRVCQSHWNQTKFHARFDMEIVTYEDSLIAQLLPIALQKLEKARELSEVILKLANPDEEDMRITTGFTRANYHSRMMELAEELR